MHLIWTSVFGLMGLLALAVLLVPAARRLHSPYTVLLAAVGCLLGFMEIALDDMPILGPVSDFLGALKGFKITSDSVFFIFLPALVFEAALTIDVRRLMDDLVPIMFLAVIGLLISTVAVAYPLSVVSGRSIVVCLLLGAIVSATDPVAVVAIFKEVGAPKRLAILVEGESLFNDATAIVAFTILVAMLTGPSEANFWSGFGAFIKIFFGGVIIGFIVGRFVCWIISLLKDLPLVAITLTLSMAYLTFILAEHYSHVSGVMAVVTAALVMGSRGGTVIPLETWHSLHYTWEQIGFWANSIIFILVGMAVPIIMAGFRNDEWILLAVIIVAAFTARAFIIFVLIPLLSHFGVSQKVNTAFKTVMFWGGLRGAVSLALALAVIENPEFEAEVRDFIGILVTGFVLFTLFVNATTIRLVMNFFGLGNLSVADITVRNRATTLSLSKVGSRLSQLVHELEMDSSVNKQISSQYMQRSDLAQEKLNRMTKIKPSEWLVIGLTTLTAQERNAYTAQYGEGYLSSLSFRLLATQVDDLADALKLNGVDGYKQEIVKSLGFDWRFRLAVSLHRRLGLTTPLSLRIAERFDVLLGTKVALRRMLHKGLPKVLSMVGDNVGDDLKNIVDFRHSETVTALDALKLQYPQYARMLEQRYLEHSAMRLEESEYQTMLSNAVINNDVFSNLQQGIQERHRNVDRMPKLDLGLEPDKMLTKVPLFKNLSQNGLNQLAKLLKPKLAFPGEMVIQEGTQGDAMYFISSGVLTVNVSDQCFMLGSGDFFGEIALIASRPRIADVVAKGFCELLALNRKDFKIFLKAHPDLSSTIEKVAQERLEIDNLSTPDT